MADSAEYWWQVCRGAEVMADSAATPESDAWSAISRHPILLLPELVDAAEQILGKTAATIGLRQMHQSLSGSQYFVPFQRMLAHTLGNTTAGSPRVNVLRALVVMSEVRAQSSAAEQAANTELEQELRAVLEATTERGPRMARGTESGEQPWARLFLDESELPDHRRSTPPIEPRNADRMFTANGGIYAAACEWLGNDATATYRIVDTRWLFPSMKAAKAYMESSATLASVGNGLPVTTAPAIGDAANAWAGIEPRTPGRQQILVFRTGRVVAKLHVTEGPRAAAMFQVLAQPMLVPIAETIVRRARWVTAQYWLGVLRGSQAVERFLETPARIAGSLFAEFPILLMPEMPLAMSSLGDRFRDAAERLVEQQAALKNNWPVYRDVLRALVRALLDDTTGEARTNADAALQLVVQHRRADSDYTWAAIENECRERSG
jgi:hypothetical protein